MGTLRCLRATVPWAQPWLAMPERVHGYTHVAQAAAGSAGPHEPSPPREQDPIPAAALQPANPGGSQRRRSSEVPEAGAQGEAPCAAAEVGYLLAGSVDFCRVEEINAIVVG